MLLVAGALALGCGGGGDDKPSTGNPGGGGGADAGGGDCSGTVTWSGTVVDATTITQHVPSITVIQVDNLTGEPVSPENKATANGDGKVSLTVTACDKFAVKAVAGQEHIDTYSFNVKPEETNPNLRLVRIASASTASTVPGLAGYTAHAETGAAAGAVYWKTPDMADYDNVGCALITDDKGDLVKDEDLRYFADQLPSPLDARGADKGTNPNNGKFFVGNISPGYHTFTAKLADGTSLGTTTLMVFPRSAASTTVKDAVSGMTIGANLFLAGIYIDAPAGAKNPTPAGCQ